MLAASPQSWLGSLAFHAALAGAAALLALTVPYIPRAAPATTGAIYLSDAPEPTHPVHVLPQPSQPLAQILDSSQKIERPSVPDGWSTPSIPVAPSTPTPQVSCWGVPSPGPESGPVLIARGHGGNPFPGVPHGNAAPDDPTSANPEPYATLTVPGGTGTGDSIGRPIPLPDNAPPLYPAESQRRHHEGTVRLAFTVRPDGSVTDITILQSSGHDLLDRAAIQAVTRWRYTPAPAAPPRKVEQPFDFILTKT